MRQRALPGGRLRRVHDRGERRGVVLGRGRGLSPGLLFMLRTVGKNSSPDVYKEAVLQTLAEIREERKAADKKD